MSIAWQWECVEACDSTNHLAAERVLERWSRGESAEGLVVMAQRQSAGRGQHGRRWESPPGGVYLSAVVENIPAEFRDRLALLAGVAVVEALQSSETYFDQEQAQREGWRVGAGLRWPNDVMVGTGTGQKAAGILCEGVAQGSGGSKWAGIVGIGVNVLTEANAFPVELRATATSLLAHDGRVRTITGVADAVIGQLTRWVGMLQDHGLVPVIERVRQADMLAGLRVRFDAGEGAFEAMAKGIDDQGRLLLQRGGREVEVFARGSILECFSA